MQKKAAGCSQDLCIHTSYQDTPGDSVDEITCNCCTDTLNREASVIHLSDEAYQVIRMTPMVLVSNIQTYVLVLMPVES